MVPIRDDMRTKTAEESRTSMTRGELRLQSGTIYRNGRGDIIGPMRALSPEMFLDQYGTLYRSNGIQYGHVPGSTGNITLSDVGTKKETP